MLVERLGIKQAQGEILDVGLGLEEGFPHQPSGQSGTTMVVEGLLQAFRIEEPDLFVPKAGGRFRKARAQLPVNFPELGVGSDAEHLEEICELARADEGELELQERILTEIDVDRVNGRRAFNEIIEHVAPGARDHDDLAVPIQLHQLAVDARILPCRVVDEIGAVNTPEDEIMSRFEDLGCAFDCLLSCHCM